eukprot:6501423-Pyramimonas_sp.AAC.1
MAPIYIHPGPEGTDTATPTTAPGARSHQDFEANLAVATRASREAHRAENRRRVAVWALFPPVRPSAPPGGSVGVAGGGS